MTARGRRGAAYRTAVRPAMFAVSRHDPERAHELVLRQMAFASRHPALLRAVAAVHGVSAQRGGRTIFGLHFPGPVGIAAGFDKNGVALPALAALGFGFVEAGTATWHAQAGHPRPRTWRFADQASIVNAMGFPNRGARAIAAFQKRAARPGVPVGWNVSKSMVTNIDGAAADVCASIRVLHPHADFFVVNVSSPNTPGLRQLEGRDRLAVLVRAALGELDGLAASGTAATPLLIKISPDLTAAQLDDVVDVCTGAGVAGIIATNTTVHRELVRGVGVPDRGGVSGRLLAVRSREVVAHLVRELDGHLPVIGVGGIDSPDAAQRMLDAGADLVQVYTGLVYQGPALVTAINREVRAAWLRAGGTAPRPVATQH